MPVFLLGHSAGGVVSSTYVLDNQKELAGFICDCFAFQVYAPSFALAAIALSYPMALGELAGNWATWWQGDACGVLIFAPLVLSWSAPGSVRWSPRRVIEAALYAALLLLT